MSDSIGGSVAITMVLIFLVIALGYLAFNVNYTKAFRMKNKIIAVYEDYNGVCNDGNGCNTEIRNYADSIGYKPSNVYCSGKGEKKLNLYCEKETIATGCTGDIECDKEEVHYFHITTAVDIEVPIIRSVVPINLEASGDTKALSKK